eukprot:CAMPEP_0197449086 /NCGR_PEP_ID=MMETSP1175-20131217/20129_1 /TAXON_ID=1003142 /ORGANISM="Triceratium dubium, Strain CCMP147" /LENGTH=263 /DNA_ID=CAMNT_0042981093 /DNA_START=45 /DNA_END=832 /DNA_ORIENTATION=-
MKRSDSKEQSKAAAWSSAGGGSGAVAAARRSSRSADELDRKISSKLASAANGNVGEKQPSTQTLQSVGGTVYEFPTTPETRNKPAAQAALPVPGTVTPVPSSAPRGKGEGNYGNGSHGRSPVPGTVTPVSALDDRIRSKASMRSGVGAVAVSNGDKSPQVSDMIRRIEAKSVVGGGGGGTNGGRGNNNPPTTPVTPVSDVDRRIQEKVRASMTKVTPRTPSSRTSSGAADGAPASTPTLSSAPGPPSLTGLKMGNEDGAFIAG